VPPLDIPPGLDRSQETGNSTENGQPDGAGEPAAARRPRRGLRARYRDLEQHELITLLDEVDDERSKARFRESVYISVIVWLVLAGILVYGPRYLWHAPVLISAVPDKKTMTYLDVPPDLKKLLKDKPAPRMSERSTEAQSPKPSPQAPEPRSGTPTPPAPKPQAQSRPQQQPPPTPQPQQQPPPQQQAKNTPPTPTPPAPRNQPLADAPAPSPNNNKSIFNQPQSARDQIQQATRNAPRGGDGGDSGSSRGQQGGNKAGLEILSDTQGVDFAKYLARLLADIKRGWLPLIPEEARPPLNKQGITGVRFAILPDGRIAPGSMHLDYSTHDVAIDRAAWGSITGLGQAQPLPKEFHGPNLELRIEFRVNKDGPEAQ
jgi:outer membrane biosynthesis protein TonB